MGGTAAVKAGARDSSNASVENMDVFTSEQTWIPLVSNIVRGRLTFLWERLNSGEDQMKPVVIKNPAASDRLATRSEVFGAMPFTSNGAFELHCTSDGYCEMESDFYGTVRIRNEDLEYWASLAEIMGLGII